MKSILNRKLLKDWLNGRNPIPTVPSEPFPSEELKLKRILFIEPKLIKRNAFSFAARFPLLGPVWMATILRERGYNVILYNENVAKKKIPNKILGAADIVIITLLSPTCKSGYLISDKYRLLRPDGKIIIGGIHPTLNIDDSLPYCDQLAVGEGGYNIIDIVENKYENQIIKCDKIADLNTLPIPNLNLLYNHKNIKMIPILTSLGCPFNCSFCCVTKMYGRSYRKISVEKLIESIKYYNPKKVFFIDDNFCVDKKRNRELFKRIDEENLKFSWITQVRADLAEDEEFIKEMALAGCKRVFIGFESINQDSLNSVEKNVKVETYIHAIKIFHKYGIPIHGMFIFGFDQDNKSVFKKTIEFAKKHKIETMHIMIITPFPGTRYYNELDKKRFRTFDTDLYDGGHIVFDPKQMTRSELYENMLKSYRQFYSFKSIFRQVGIDIKNFRKEYLRSKKYRLKKIWFNFLRNIGYHFLIIAMRFYNRKYRRELKNSTGLYSCEINAKENKVLEQNLFL